MSKKIVVVFGATGKQGGSVVNSLLDDPVTKDAFEIYGVTRDPSSKGGQNLSKKGVKPVKADMNDSASLKAAVKDAYAVFALTDYWALMDMKKEIAQGKAIADACKEAGVQHTVWSSLINVSKETNGALPNVYHFDGKNEVEQYIRHLGIPATFFYPGFYMQNIPSSLQKNEDGITFAAPIPDSSIYPLFNVFDTGKWVKAILKRGIDDSKRSAILGEKVYAATDYYTGKQLVETIGKVTGKKTTFQTISDDTFKGIMTNMGMPDFAAQEMLENMKLLQPQYGYYVKASLQPSLEMLEEKPTSWEEYVRSEKSEFA